MTQINQLSGFQTKEVSIVDSGANLKPRFSVTKSEDNMEAALAVLKTKAEGEDKFVEALKAKNADQKTIDAAVAHYRLTAGFKDVEGVNLPEILKAAGVELPSATTKAAPTETPEPKGDEVDPELGVTRKELEAMPEGARKRLETIAKSNATLEKSVKALEDKAAMGEFVAKAKEKYSHIPGTDEELGQTLKDAYGVSEAFGKSIEEQWGRMAKALKNSPLLRPAGTEGGGSVSGSAWDDIKKAAMTLTLKDENGNDLSEAKKIAKFLDTPEGKVLYEQYLDENPAQTGARA